MKNRSFSNDFLSALCMELSLLLHAGISVGDGMQLLLQEAEGEVPAALNTLAELTEQGYPLSTALERAGGFPDYMLQMVVTGERTGRLEEALRALSSYYDSRRRLNERIRAALLYPAILALLMLAVIVILIVRVLPVFDQVYRQLGGRLSGLGGGLLRFGQGLSAAAPVLLVILAVIVAIAAIFALVPAARAALGRRYRAAFGGKGLQRGIAAARFASAMAMGMNSGLPVEDSLELAASFQKDNPPMLRRVEHCRALLDEGAPLATALAESGLFPAAYCRMIALGIRSGAGDSMMQEVAARMEEDAEEQIERAVGRVEPALVIISSLIVGIVILSVMLPLMNILSAIG